MTVAVDVNTIRRAELRGALELERCRRSVLYWMERYAYTRDEKDINAPYKPLIAGPRAVDPRTLRCRPLQDDQDDFLRWLTLLWYYNKCIVLPKSRQMRISWWVMGCSMWLAQFRVAQRIGVQSKQLHDADKMIVRGEVILELQRKVAPLIPWPDYKKRFAYMNIRHGGATSDSKVEGLAQGGHKVRGEAYSMLFSDEMAFQPEGEEAYAAAMPIIEGGARYVAVSSVMPGAFFQELANDHLR